MKKSLLILPFVLVAAALALTACGGGGSSSSSGDESAIEEAIETAATSSEPSKCTEVQTKAFTENETSETGKAAVKTCEENAEEGESPAESVTVSNVEVNGETATAAVAISGSSALNGQTIEVELAKEEGKWKLNKFLSFAKFDGKALGEELEKRLVKEEGISASLAKCVSEGVAKVSQAEAESMVFEKNLTPVEELAEKCH